MGLDRRLDPAGLQDRGEGRGEAGQTDRQEEEGQRGGSGASKKAQVHVALAPLRGWRTVVLAGEVWAVCQEEAPLYPSLHLCKVWQRSLLFLSLALCALSLKALLCHWRWQQGAPSLETEEVVRQREPGQQACVSGGRNMDGPVPLAHALMDSLLLCLLSETLEEPKAPHIQTLAHRLEMVTEALQRADILQTGDVQGQTGDVQGQTGGVEDPRLTYRLRGICAYLQQRARSLHALAKAQGDYGYSVREVQAVVQQHWTRLVELHVRVTVRRKREGEDVRKERGGEEDVETALRDVQHLFTECDKVRGRLQQCRTHLSEVTHLLQELDGGQQALGDRGGARVECLWTERLLQANTKQCEEVSQDFLSLERLTSCFQAHLKGLRPNGLERAAPSTPPVLCCPLEEDQSTV
ncbi:hypothetical protein AAFF_G00346670 [Aldrovandia affinis]|uniref:Uncharacterized protein n=1 Tax=Aldrovandia affinis TaxID=143900 RepID=A0AAD7WPP4_9TELE|nr:hypothetical protein AAFF_G00346670 [Aldrovandia affinis]